MQDTMREATQRDCLDRTQTPRSHHHHERIDAIRHGAAVPIQQVPVPPLDLGRLAAVLYDDQAAQLGAAAARAREVLSGRVVWNVNSTAHGGGVAEMLRSLLAYTRGAGVDTRWIVIG